ncbi:MAG: ATP-dependent zinc protease [Gammaproteobacteria bacterium]|nr:ATP-dependent zinc protease [Gammaproteobacteria bacterium]
MTNNEIITIGWREWCSLPELGLNNIKAKIDTGARTSCLHAFSTEDYIRDGQKWVRFGMHPNQKDTNTEIYCEAKIVDERDVTDSGGHKEKRYVISTQLVLGSQQWPIELTLTNRDSMTFRMLLGRTAMKERVIVNPDKSFILGKKTDNKTNKGV